MHRYTLIHITRTISHYHFVYILSTTAKASSNSWMMSSMSSPVATKLLPCKLTSANRIGPCRLLPVLQEPRKSWILYSKSTA